MKIVVEPHDFYIFGDGFIAFDDGVFPDGPVGVGRTRKEALEALLWQVDNDDAAVAQVEAEIAKLQVPA